MILYGVWGWNEERMGAYLQRPAFICILLSFIVLLLLHKRGIKFECMYKNIKTTNVWALRLTPMLYRARRSKELHRFFSTDDVQRAEKIGNHRSPMMLPLLLHMQQLYMPPPSSSSSSYPAVLSVCLCIWAVFSSYIIIIIKFCNCFERRRRKDQRKIFHPVGLAPGTWATLRRSAIFLHVLYRIRSKILHANTDRIGLYTSALCT
jgi:hypothetical protein